jgi:uncharacterized protein (DUF427 family)
VRPEGLGQFKESTSLGYNPATFWFVALCYRMPLTAMHLVKDYGAFVHYDVQATDTGQLTNC